MHRTHLPGWANERAERLRPPINLEPSRTAVLVIDMQDFFVIDGQPMATQHARDIVPNINRVTAALRSTGAQVVFTQQRTPGPTTPTGRSLTAALRSGLQPGAPAFELHAGLERLPADVVVIKEKPSAFHPLAGTSLLKDLHDRSITTLVITGVVTNGCCETTARDAFQHGFRVIVVSDANAALTDEEHNAALLNLAVFFADVMTTDELLSRCAT